jgi:hypothetical protein
MNRLDASREPVRGTTPRWIIAGILLTGFASVAGVATMVTMAVAKVRAGKGLETFPVYPQERGDSEMASHGGRSGRWRANSVAALVLVVRHRIDHACVCNPRECDAHRSVDVLADGRFPYMVRGLGSIDRRAASHSAPDRDPDPVLGAVGVAKPFRRPRNGLQGDGGHIARTTRSWMRI